MSETVQLAIIATIVPTITVLLTWLNTRKRSEKIHKLVNSNHQAALATIKELQRALDTRKTQQVSQNAIGTTSESLRRPSHEG